MTYHDDPRKALAKLALEAIPWADKRRDDRVITAMVARALNTGDRADLVRALGALMAAGMEMEE